MINILMVDDHSIVREGLRRIIEEKEEMKVASEATTGEEALHLISKEIFDIVLLDISMPGKNGLQTLKEIKKYKSTIPILMLSMHAEEQYALRAIKAGASGYLTKDSAPEQLVIAIKKVCSGRKYISPEVAELLATDLYHKENKQSHEYLSDREFEIMKLLVKGHSARKMATALSISDKTVSTYRSRIMKKMHMSNISELIHYAIENNLVD